MIRSSLSPSLSLGPRERAPPPRGWRAVVWRRGWFVFPEAPVAGPVEAITGPPVAREAVPRRPLAVSPRRRIAGLPVAAHAFPIAHAAASTAGFRTRTEAACGLRTQVGDDAEELLLDRKSVV